MTKPEQHWFTASSVIGENEHQFRQMIDALPAAIYITDAEGRLTHFNPAAVEFSGREPVLGSDQWCVTWKLYYPDGTPMPHEKCPMAIALKEDRSIKGAEAIAERPDGERIWFEAYPSPLRNEEGEIIGGINMLVDVSERKRADKQLRRNERELADFFENATIGLHWVGPDGTVLRANHAELDLLGYTREEYVGRHIADFYPNQDEIDDILRRLRAGEELHDYEARMRCKDGSIRHVLISTNVLWEEGEFSHTRCFTRDITERKQAEKNLQSSEERFRTMMEQSPLSMQIFDAEGRTVAVNSAWERLWNAPREELVDYNILKDEQLKAAGLISYIQKAFDGEVVRLPETYYNPAEIDKPGRGRWIEGYIYPLTSRDGETFEVALVHHDITERKEAEQALRKSEERLRFALEAGEIGIWDWDIDSDTVTWSESLETIHGMNRGEFDGRFESLINAIHPDDRDRVLAMIHQTLEEEAPYNIEYRRVRRDGEVIWLESKGQVVRDEDGRAVRMSGTCLDITRRKRMVQAMQKSERWFRQLLEKLPAAAYTCDSKGLITYFNQQAAEVWGREPELNNSIDRFCGSVQLYSSDGSPISHSKCWMALALKNEKEYNEKEIIIERPDGQRITALVYATPIQDESGELIGAVNIVVDIGKRKQMEEALRESEVQLEADLADSKLLQDISAQLIEEENTDALYEKIIDAATTIMRSKYVSMQMLYPERGDGGELRLLTFRGFSPQAVELWEWVSPASASVCGMALHAGERVIVPDVEQCEPMTGSEDLQMFLQTGIRAVQSTPLFSRNGQMLGMISTQWSEPHEPSERDLRLLDILARQAADLIERKQAKEELQAVNETLEERVEERTAALLSYQDQLRSLASELSKAEERERQRLATNLHDNLGQILAIGKMKLDLLQLHRNKLPDRAASGMDELTELMDDAISYTRELMTELKPPPSLDEEDVRASIAWVGDKMSRYNLKVTIEDDGQPKPISEEIQTTLRQCVRELLFNIVKHAGVNEARITLSRADGQVQIIVEDEGIGFSMKGKEPAPTEEGGFGLFNIKERMGLLGGSLKVTSKPGKGTKMALRVPAKDKDKSDMPILSNMGGSTPPSGLPEQTGSDLKIKVLLVDDHQMMREGLQRIIEEEDDLTVIGEASDGEEAVKLAQEAYPDVIIMDVNMPGMNGIEATREITSNTPQVRIIGLSLQEEKNVAEAMRSAGASAYLTKSEVFETLCATIRSEAMMAMKPGTGAVEDA